jgi:hypothetical protein
MRQVAGNMAAVWSCARGRVIIFGVIQCFLDAGVSNGLHKMSLMYYQVSANDSIKGNGKKPPCFMLGVPPV